eukprot:6030517-Prymnesium_polylepis.1
MYIADCQIWLRQLFSLVGEQAWSTYSDGQKFKLARLRGELLFFGHTPELHARLASSRPRSSRGRSSPGTCCSE